MSATTVPGPTGARQRTHPADHPRQSRSGVVIPTAIVGLLCVYVALPFWWLLIGATKSQADLFDSAISPMWFSSHFDLFQNIAKLFEYSGGLYARWLINSLIYAIVGGVGATAISTLGGYGLSLYRFRGRKLFFAVTLGSVMVPATVLVIPQFVLLSDLHLSNTIWSVILPSVLNPFAIYLMKVYTDDSIPVEVIDAARVDGSGEFRIFSKIALPMMRPAIVTVLLLTVVATWNNFFLPLVMLSNPRLFPITVGLNALQSQAQVATGGTALWNLVITGAFISILPLIAAFIGLQKYWQGGLTIGSVK